MIYDPFAVVLSAAAVMEILEGYGVRIPQQVFAAAPEAESYHIARSAHYRASCGCNSIQLLFLILV
jgi:hypothetical protein